MFATALAAAAGSAPAASFAAPHAALLLVKKSRPSSGHLPGDRAADGVAPQVEGQPEQAIVPADLTDVRTKLKREGTTLPARTL